MIDKTFTPNTEDPMFKGAKYIIRHHSYDTDEEAIEMMQENMDNHDKFVSSNRYAMSEEAIKRTLEDRKKNPEKYKPRSIGVGMVRFPDHYHRIFRSIMANLKDTYMSQDNEMWDEISEIMSEYNFTPLHQTWDKDI